MKQELKIAEKIFSSGISEEEFPGLKSIAALLDETETKLDYWIIYELGGPCLTKNLFEVKGQFHKGERIYNVDHQPFYFALKNDMKLFKQFVRKLLEVFDLLSCLDIVHADIKPDNILVDFDQKINTIKFIDFGSSFVFSEAKSVPATTPEYLPPEVLTFLENRGKGAMESSSQLFKRMKNWSFDMWSLGALLLEILSGFPLWLSYKGKIVNRKGKTILNHGIFGVSARSNSKIITKQAAVLKNIGAAIKKYDSYGFERETEGMDLLACLLDPNPKRRITPQEALMHPFLQ